MHDAMRKADSNCCGTHPQSADGEESRLAHAVREDTDRKRRQAVSKSKYVGQNAKDQQARAKLRGHRNEHNAIREFKDVQQAMHR